jgi:uncharacterized protein (DUF58 family)
VRANGGLPWQAPASEQPRFTALLDTRPGALGAAAFEEAVDLVASLLTAAAVAGQHSRLITSSGVDVPTAGGVRAARQLLDELAEIAPSGAPGGPLVPRTLAASGTVTGGCLALVTSPAADLRSLSAVRDRFSTRLVFALGDAAPRAVTVAGTRVLGASDAAGAVRLWNEVAT